MESTLKPIILSKLDAILQSIEIIEQRSCNYEDVHIMLSSFIGSAIFDSCVLRLQTIGENIKAIDERTHGSFLSQYPDTPWHKLIGLRNILAHQYENVDPDIVWSVVKRHLTPLKDTVTKIKSDLSK